MSRLRRAPQHPSGPDRRGPDLRSARHLAPQQVPLRPGLHHATGFRPGRPADSAVVLDHLPRPLGASRRQVLTAADPVVSAASFSATLVGTRVPATRCSCMRDVLIIGGGPGGLETARLLAGEGFDVAVYEEHATSGDPVHCTGVLAVEAFDQLGLSRDVILNPLSTARFFAPSGATVEHTTPDTEAVVVDRLALDRALFDAARAGRRHARHGASRDGRPCRGHAASRSRSTTARPSGLAPACWHAAPSTPSSGGSAWAAGGVPSVGADGTAGRPPGRRRGPVWPTCGARRLRLDGAGRAAVGSARPRRADVRPPGRPFLPAA